MCTLQLGPTHAMHEFVDKHSNLDRLVKHVPHGCSGKEPLILAERYLLKESYRGAKDAK